MAKPPDIIRAYRPGARSPRPFPWMWLCLVLSLVFLALAVVVRSAELTVTNNYSDGGVALDLYNAGGKTDTLYIPRLATVTFTIPDDSEWCGILHQEDTITSANQNYLDFKYFNFSGSARHMWVGPTISISDEPSRYPGGGGSADSWTPHLVAIGIVVLALLALILAKLYAK